MTDSPAPFSLSSVSCTALRVGGTPLDAAPFAAVLRSHHGGRLVEFAHAADSTPRDLLRAYASADREAREDVDSALASAVPLSVRGREFRAPLPRDVLDGVPRGVPDEAGVALRVDALALVETGIPVFRAWYGIRVRGQGCDEFRAVRQADLVGADAAALVEMARETSAEASHAVSAWEASEADAMVAGETYGADARPGWR